MYNVHVIFLFPLLTFQKLQERQSSFKKKSYEVKAREKWSKVLTSTFISSEESGEEDEIIVKSLPWRAPRVDAFFRSLDESSKNGKSPQSRRQMKNRVFGQHSTRPKPSGIPSWASVN